MKAFDAQLPFPDPRVTLCLKMKGSIFRLACHMSIRAIKTNSPLIMAEVREAENVSQRWTPGCMSCARFAAWAVVLCLLVCTVESDDTETLRLRICVTLPMKTGDGPDSAVANPLVVSAGIAMATAAQHIAQRNFTLIPDGAALLGQRTLRSRHPMRPALFTIDEPCRAAMPVQSLKDAGPLLPSDSQGLFRWNSRLLTCRPSLTHTTCPWRSRPAPSSEAITF